jgi:hypothetical protein
VWDTVGCAAKRTISRDDLVIKDDVFNYSDSNMGRYTINKDASL